MSWPSRLWSWAGPAELAHMAVSAGLLGCGAVALGRNWPSTVTLFLLFSNFVIPLNIPKINLNF
jgi:hypothetical protein